MLLAGLVLVLGPGGDFACLASDDPGTPVVQSPSALPLDIVWANEADWGTIPDVDRTDYGTSVASAGDVDGDFRPDVLVGAPKDETIDGSGAAYLFRSNPIGLDETPAWAAGGGVHAVNFGSAVAGAGDVNGDGFEDAIIADDSHKAYLEVRPGESQWVQAGRAFVYEGVDGVGLSLEPTWSYTGTVREGRFASAVAGAGDVNGDGVDDIVVGARLYGDTENNEGAVYVFFGHGDEDPDEDPGPSAEWDWRVDSNQPGAMLGYAVGAAGDVNGDGCDDLIAGAPFYPNPDTGAEEGAVFLFLGRGGVTCPGSPPTSVADAAGIAYGGQEESWFGFSVAGAVHVDGDGYLDVVVSTPYYERPSDGVQVGAAFGYCWNGSGLGSKPCWTVYGDQPGGGFGYSVASAGDVDGDLFGDLIVGAPTYEPDPLSGREGAAFIYFGSVHGLWPWAGWIAGGNKATTDFGASVSGVEDIGEEGSDGVIIGSPRYFANEKDPYGAAFCFYGPLEPAEPYRTYLPLITSGAN